MLEQRAHRRRHQQAGAGPPGLDVGQPRAGVEPRMQVDRAAGGQHGQDLDAQAANMEQRQHRQRARRSIERLGVDRGVDVGRASRPGCGSRPWAARRCPRCTPAAGRRRPLLRPRLGPPAHGRPAAPTRARRRPARPALRRHATRRAPHGAPAAPTRAPPGASSAARSAHRGGAQANKAASIATLLRPSQPSASPRPMPSPARRSHQCATSASSCA